MSDGRVLLVDDEPQLVRVLRPSLIAAGYEVEAVGSGEAALRALENAPPDIVILDLGLPDLDGKVVIERIRQQSGVPIVVLSARDAEQEKVDALDRGANDFVNKPFSTGELMARLRAALRQRSAGARTVLQFGHLAVDLASKRVRYGAREVRLSPREFKLLSLMIDRIDQVLTHKQIVTAVWGEDQDIEPQFVRVLVANLRQKVEIDPRAPQVILTEPGIGYRFKAPAA